MSTTAEQLQAFRLSPVQRRLWALGRNAAEHVLRARLEIDGVAGETVRKTLEAIAVRHENLRSDFRLEPGADEPLQCPAASPLLDWQSANVKAITEPGAHSGLRAWWQPTESGGMLDLSLPVLCADRRSVILIAEELARNLSAGDPGNQRESNGGASFSRIAEWQNSMFEEDGDEMRQTRAVFAKRLVDSWDALIPGGQPKDEARGSGFDLRRVPVSLSSSTERALVALAGEARTSPERVVMAAWAALVSWLSGQPRPVIGYLFAGRDFEVLEEMIGPFSKCLPLRFDLSGESALEGLTAWLDAALAEAEEHHEGFLLGGRQEFSPSEETPCHLPFGFEDEERHAVLADGDVAVRLRSIEGVNERFDLLVRVVKADGALSVELEHDPFRYESAFADRLAARLGALLVHLGDEPRAPLSSWRMLAPDERSLIAELGGQDDRPVLEEPGTLQALFSASRPDELAVVCESGRLTWRELDRRSADLALRLAGLGAGPESVVGLCADRAPALIVGMVGILRAGAAYLPLSPTLPAARGAGMLSDAGARMLVAQDGMVEEASRVDGLLAHVLLTSDGSLVEVDGPMGEPSPCRPENLAYVLFTSGSTGRPKAVAVEHRQVVGYLGAVIRRLDLRPGTSYASASTFAADLGLTSILPAIFEGGELQLLSRRESMDAAAFSARLHEHPVDVLKIVPSHLKTLLDTAAGELPLPRRQLVLGGEALPWELADRLRSSTVELWNHYGPTETTVGVAAALALDAASPHTGHSVPLGRPLGHARLYVVDRQGRQVAVGMTGEILIGGGCVSRGYLGQPGATAERFQPDPFAGKAGARLYRSGDAAQLLDRGEIVFAGRFDHQVKVRGFRVECGEVETALAADPTVRAAAVVVRGEGGDSSLAAFVVPLAGQKIDVDGLRGRLAESLPDYMVPTAWRVLERLPLTSNGKLDRAALALEEEQAASTEPPSGPIEEAVAAVWSELLDRTEIGRNESFFEIGGHSLLAMQAVARLRELFTVSFSLGELFDGPTVSAIASAIVGAEGTPGHCEKVAKVFLRVRSMSSDEVDAALTKKRFSESEAAR